LRHLRGPIILLWDRGSIHRGPPIEAVCQAHPRLHLEKFPAYAPELNPTEQVWNDFKGRTANSLLRDTRELRQRLDHPHPVAVPVDGDDDIFFTEREGGV
jgi:transposase